MARKEQRMTVVHTLNGDGSVRIQLLFYPPLANNEAEFNALSPERRILNNATLDSGKCMMAMLQDKMAKEKELADVKQSV
jgi:hypothetical protein